MELPLATPSALFLSSVGIALAGVFVFSAEGELLASHPLGAEGILVVELNGLIRMGSDEFRERRGHDTSLVSNKDESSATTRRR